MIFFDLETYPITRVAPAPKPVCIAWGTSRDDIRVQHIDEVKGRVRDWLRTEHLVNHNITYDLACIGQYWPEFLPLVFQAYSDGRVQDTILREKVVDIGHKGGLRESYSLEAVAARRGLPLMEKDAWRTHYQALDGIPIRDWPEGAREYPKNDVRAVIEIFEKQASPNLALVPELSAHDFALHLLSCHGVHTNQERVEKLLVQVEKNIVAWAKTLQEHGLVRKKDGSRDIKAATARMEAACKALGREPKLTDKGRISLDADACVLSQDPILVLYSDYSSATTLRNKVIDLSYGYDLPLQTRFNSLVNTCRTSSQKPTLEGIYGWQAQNPPKAQGARECLEPRPGHVFLIGDYPSAELYSVAQYCHVMGWKPRLRDMLISGRDMHSDLAARTLGKTYEEVFAGRKGTYKKDRDLAKNGNYGFWGGMGVDRFILQARENSGEIYRPEQVSPLRAAWFEMLPETRPFFGLVNQMLGNRERFDMTHPITGFRRSGLTYCSGSNFTFQHLTAHAAKSALFEIVRRCYTGTGSDLYGCRMWNFPHDEICGESPEAQAHCAALEMAKIMGDKYNEWTPDVPLSVEVAVSRVWSKGVEPVWENSHLIPWTMDIKKP